MYIRLCKAGYVQNINEAKQLDARTVIQALHYENFLQDYESTFMELNKK